MLNMRSLRFVVMTILLLDNPLKILKYEADKEYLTPLNFVYRIFLTHTPNIYLHSPIILRYSPIIHSYHLINGLFFIQH